MQILCCQRALFFSMALTAGFAAISCRQEPKSTTGADSREIRGEPIAPAVVSQESAAAAVKAEVIASSSPLRPQEPAGPRPPEIPASTASTSAQIGQNESASSEPFVLGFEKLSAFSYDMPTDLLETNVVVAAKSSDKIPPEVRAFDKKAVSLKGFMLPLKVEGGLVTELLIMRDQSMCCYGAVPKINEWVSVKMNGKGVKPLMDQPITLTGTLHVGEVRENGYLVGIYQLDGDRITNPPGL